jgi:chromosome segregation protein
VAEVKKQLNSLERQARQARSYQTLQQEARGLEIELLSRDYRTMHADLESVDHEAREVEAQEAEQVAEQARLDSEQEAIRLRMNDAAEAIARVRDTLAGTEQRQSQALTAAEVERNRTELFERQRMQAAQEMERLAADQEQAQSEIETLRAMLLQLEGDIVEQEAQFQQADVEAKSLAGHRASAVAEEERARKDVLNLAVLVANTEQSLTQVTARQQETAARAERVSREQEQLTAQVAGLDQQRDLLAAQREEASGRIQELMAERQAAIERIEGLGGQITGLDRDIVKFSEDVAGVESRLGALQGVVREEMGYGREGEEEGTALKTCDGVREALAEWLVIPPGLDRAVETILGERVRGWLVDEPSAACRAVEFLKGKELGRGAFLPQQLRWAPEQAALDSSASWWPTLNGQPGVVGRATDLIRAEGASAATLSYLFDGIVFVESLDVALQLWQQHQWAAPAGPTYVTLSGETLDAAGVMTGGGSSASGGLLQRRREVLELEARRTAAVQALEQARAAREEAAAELGLGREDEQRLGRAIREAEMLELSLQKDDAGVERQRGELHRRMDVLAEELQRSLAEQARLQEEFQSSQAQLGQWVAEKAGQETGLLQVRERLVVIESQSLAIQQRLTEVRLSLESMRGRREHATNDIARFTQRLDAAQRRATDLEEQVAGLVEATENSREEQTRQEALCRELGAEVDGIKAELVAAQERQAQEMAGLHAVEETLSQVRQSLSALHDRRMRAEVRKAEVKAHLSTIESTLAGTYQIEPATLLLPVVISRYRRVKNRRPRSRFLKRRNCGSRFKKSVNAWTGWAPSIWRPSTSIVSWKSGISSSRRRSRTSRPPSRRSRRSSSGSTGRRRTCSWRRSTSCSRNSGTSFPSSSPVAALNCNWSKSRWKRAWKTMGAREPGVEIVAQPPGKRLKSITMLSGGEKTLTAMALLIASFLIRPTPFCILDEIDAPLDEENIGRFTSVLRSLSSTAQFMVITHNKRTMAMADSLFGVTMEEPGVSTLISVKLGDLQPA